MEAADSESQEVNALFALVSARYGVGLTAAQLEEVRKGVETVVKGARALRAVRLENGHEPIQCFVPFRAEA